MLRHCINEHLFFSIKKSDKMFFFYLWFQLTLAWGHLCHGHRCQQNKALSFSVHATCRKCLLEHGRFFVFLSECWNRFQDTVQPP